MTKRVITRHTSDSLTGRRMMSAKGARVVTGKSSNLSKEQQEWNQKIEDAKQKKGSNHG